MKSYNDHRVLITVIAQRIDQTGRSKKLPCKLYKDKVSVGSVKVADSGNVDPQTAKRMVSEYSLDKTPV